MLRLWYLLFSLYPRICTFIKIMNQAPNIGVWLSLKFAKFNAEYLCEIETEFKTCFFLQEIHLEKFKNMKSFNISWHDPFQTLKLLPKIFSLQVSNEVWRTQLFEIWSHVSFQRGSKLNKIFQRIGWSNKITLLQPYRSQ